ncbi:MAG: amino acid ABC transporter substrate-binding protein [Gammaproteobacteria bacterium]
MRIVSVLFSALLLMSSSLWATDALPTLQQIEESGKIRIGYRQTLPPMSFHDDQGAPAGYSIDLCNRIVTLVKTTLDKSDIEVEHVPVNAENRFSALTENEIDILCGATTKTLSRSQLVDFTQLTFVTGAGFLSLKQAPINTIPGLQGKKIAVVANTTTEEALESVLKQTLTDTEVVTVESAAQGMELLNAGEVAAYTADQIVLIGMLITADQPNRFHVSGNLYSFEPLALAVRRNDADFRLIADRVLSQLYRSGGIVPIYRKWFGEISDNVPSAISAAYEINATPE